MKSISVKTKPAERILSVDVVFNCISIASMFGIKLKYEEYSDSYRIIYDTKDKHNLHVVRFRKDHISRIRRYHNKKLNVLFTTIEIKIDGKIIKENL